VTVRSAATPLQAARLALGWSQARLIHELHRASTASGVTIQSRASLKVSISKWENGRTRVSPVYQRLFRSLYKMTDAELGFTQPCTGLEIWFPAGWTEGVSEASALWRSDVTGDAPDGVFAAADFATPALRWMLGERDEPGRTNGRLLVGAPHVQAIRQMTTSMRAIDNEYGGGYARASVVRYLHHEVSPLLRDGRYDARLGADLCSATAEMTQLAGWMTYDAGQHRLAQRYLVDALRLAMAAGDRPLGAEILAAMSHQCTYLGQGAAGVDLARVAGRTAVRAGISALVAEAAVLEAHGHANQRDERASTVALGRAERALDHADRSADPAFITYFDEAYLSAKFGHCFRELGRPRQAKRFAIRSLQMDDRYIRGKMFNLALLATAHAQDGEIEDACRVGSQALSMAVELQSARAIGYINSLRRDLAAHQAAPAVGEFEARAAAAIA
jgi:transcriptional regulator with XRE-family HTH domain